MPALLTGSACCALDVTLSVSQFVNLMTGREKIWEEHRWPQVFQPKGPLRKYHVELTSQRKTAG